MTNAFKDWLRDTFPECVRTEPMSDLVIELVMKMSDEELNQLLRFVCKELRRRDNGLGCDKDGIPF